MGLSGRLVVAVVAAFRIGLHFVDLDCESDGFIVVRRGLGAEVEGEGSVGGYVGG